MATKNFLYVLIPLLLLPVGAPLFVSYFQDEPVLDPFTYYFQWPDTVYAKGYSESRFKQIRRGMSTATVKEMIGAPLVKWEKCGSKVIGTKILVGDEYLGTYQENDDSCTPDNEVWGFSTSGARSNYFFSRRISTDLSSMTVSSVMSSFED